MGGGSQVLGAEGPLEFQGKRRTWGKKLGGKEGAENLPLSVDSVGCACLFSARTQCLLVESAGGD